MPPNWGEFGRKPASDDQSVRDEWAKLNARLFGSPDGRMWLEAMREDKFGRATSPNMPEAELRHLEGQRQLLRDIDRLVAEVDAQASAKKPA